MAGHFVLLPEDVIHCFGEISWLVWYKSPVLLLAVSLLHSSGSSNGITVSMYSLMAANTNSHM